MAERNQWCTPSEPVQVEGNLTTAPAVNQALPPHPPPPPPPPIPAPPTRPLPLPPDPGIQGGSNDPQIQSSGSVTTNLSPVRNVVSNNVVSSPFSNIPSGSASRTKRAIACGLLDVALMAIAPLVLFTLFATLYAAIRQEKTVRSRPAIVEIRDKMLFVDGQPFLVRGVNFSPVWAGRDARKEYPYGDYMGDGDFNEYCDFHLAKIAQAGFNTIRVYNWILARDHSAFLDLADKHRLKVIVTFWMDSRLYPDLALHPELALTNFRHMVRTYKRHPAVLLWAIGNEPNLPSNDLSFATQLRAFFFFIRHLREVRDQEELGHPLHPHPMMVPLADYQIVDTISENDPAAVEIWGIQLYRSVQDLDSILGTIVTDKPILVSEFGMDSFIDKKQTRVVSAFLPRNDTERMIAERNQVSYLRDMLRVFNKYLALKRRNSIDPEILPHNLPLLISPPSPPSSTATSIPIRCSSGNSNSSSNGTLEQRWLKDFNCSSFNKVIGTVVFEWMDEWWKAPPDDLWHPDCTTDDASKQSACGIWQKDYGDDERLNEEYFGLVAQPSADLEFCRLSPKPAYCVFAKWYRGSALYSPDCATGTPLPTVEWAFELPVPWTARYSVTIHLATVWGFVGALLLFWLLGGIYINYWKTGHDQAPGDVPQTQSPGTQSEKNKTKDQKKKDQSGVADEIYVPIPPPPISFGPSPTFGIVDSSEGGTAEGAFFVLRTHVEQELTKFSEWLTNPPQLPGEEPVPYPVELIGRTYMTFVASALYRTRFFPQDGDPQATELKYHGETPTMAQFSDEDVSKATKRVYQDLIPSGIGTAEGDLELHELTSPTNVNEVAPPMVVNALLFLVIQQRLENLRQAKWMKWKLWRCLQCSFLG